jgi:hypothetical protein
MQPHVGSVEQVYSRLAPRQSSITHHVSPVYYPQHVRSCQILFTRSLPAYEHSLPDPAGRSLLRPHKEVYSKCARPLARLFLEISQPTSSVPLLIRSNIRFLCALGECLLGELTAGTLHSCHGKGCT